MEPDRGVVVGFAYGLEKKPEPAMLRRERFKMVTNCVLQAAWLVSMVVYAVWFLRQRAYVKKLAFELNQRELATELIQINMWGIYAHGIAAMALAVAGLTHIAEALLYGWL